jgi:transcriptional regulator with XRE-family HTH domain
MYLLMIEENLGEALRQIRARQHLSLRMLAERTGFSASFLSQVENGQSAPSISSIERITRELGVTLAQFFGAMEHKDGGLVAEHVHHEWQRHWPDAQLQPVGRRRDRESLAAWAVTLDSTGSTQPHAIPFHNFAYVLEGSVTLTLEEAERHVLLEGDGIAIQGGKARRWENSGNGKSRVLLVCDLTGRPD